MDYTCDEAGNRLTRVTYDDGTNPVADMADYRYDAIGRRIEYVDHVRYNPDTQSPGVTIRYFHDGQTLDSPAGLGPGAFGTHAWRAPACQGQNVVEEYDGDDTVPLRQRGYINGAQYIDERVVMRLYDVDAYDHYYIHQELYTVTGLVARNGLFEEAYQYDAYGQATIYQWPFGDVNWDGQTASGDVTIVKARSGQSNPDPWADLNMDGQVASGDVTLVKGASGQTLDEINYSSLDNPFFFTGRLTDTLHASAYEIDIPWICWDPEDPECEDPVEGVDYDALARRLQDNRNRTYDPRHGRWLQRDLLGTLPALDGKLEIHHQYVDGVNLYQYVHSSPADLADALGLACGVWFPIMGQKPYSSWKTWTTSGEEPRFNYAANQWEPWRVTYTVDFQLLYIKLPQVKIIGKTTWGAYEDSELYIGPARLYWAVPAVSDLIAENIDANFKVTPSLKVGSLCRKLERCVRKCRRCCRSILWGQAWFEEGCAFTDKGDGSGYSQWWFGITAWDSLAGRLYCDIKSIKRGRVIKVEEYGLFGNTIHWFTQPNSQLACGNKPDLDNENTIFGDCKFTGPINEHELPPVPESQTQ